MQCDITENENGTIVAISGNVTINHANQLLEILKARIVRGTRITVNLAHITECDTALFQLLCSAHKSIFAISGSMTITGLSTEFMHIASLGGFFRKTGCAGLEHDCFLRLSLE